MTFQRLLCIFGIHEYTITSSADYEVKGWNDWYEISVIQTGKVFYLECQCCHKPKKVVLV